MKNKLTVKMLVEGGVMLALAYVLSLVVIFQMPSGGSITAVSMLPILIYAVRYGAGPGLFVAIVYGTFSLSLGPSGPSTRCPSCLTTSWASASWGWRACLGRSF